MGKILRSSVVVAGCSLWLGAFGQSYTIDSFDAYMKLGADGIMTVDEQIRVTFHETKHGIYRFMPNVYDTGKGIERRIFISNISVTDFQGEPQTSLITHEGSNIKIRIGDADVTFGAGAHKDYRISYQVRNMMNWFDKESDWEPYAELYWNVTGDQWDARILKASFQIDFPKADGGKGLRARVFAGAYGSRDEQTLQRMAQEAYGPATDTTMSLSPTYLKVRRNSPMEPYTGLTAVLNVPAGLIAKPTTWQLAQDLLMANLGFCLPILIIPALFLLWARFGRDPKQGPLVVQFDPPDDLSGPESGTLIDERVDQRDIAAGIISLAVKGFVTITPKEEGLIFKRRTADLHLTEKGDFSPLTKFEQKLYNLLAASGTVVTPEDLRTDVAPHLSTLRQSLYDCLKDRGYYLKSPESVRITWSILGVIVIVALAIFATVLSPFGNPLPGIVGGIVSAIALFIFVPLMPRRTVAGAKAQHLLRGFEEFMRRARADDLKWLSEKHPDQALFEKYIPHAVAFGLTAQWAAAFRDIALETPHWYASSGPFNPIWFGSDLSGVSSSLSSAAATPPRSSGGSGGSSGFSSGGGFSGGGFGGGGGGSW